jgi:hypothetical protein
VRPCDRGGRPAADLGGRQRELFPQQLTSADAAVDEHLDPPLYRLDDLTECIDARRHAVELATAVVRDHESCCPMLAHARRASSAVSTPFTITGGPESAASRSRSRQTTEALTSEKSSLVVPRTRPPSTASRLGTVSSSVI